MPITDPARVPTAVVRSTPGETPPHIPELLEYSALKQEQSTRIVLRETALYANLSVAAAAVIGYFEADSSFTTQFLLLLPPVSAVMFWIYFNNDYYVNELGSYVSNVLDRRLRSLLEPTAADAAANETRGTAFFNWEEFHRRKSFSRSVRKSAQLVTLAMCFLALPVFAVAMAYAEASTQSLFLALWSFDVAITLFVAAGVLWLSSVSSN